LREHIVNYEVVTHITDKLANPHNLPFQRPDTIKQHMYEEEEVEDKHDE